MKIVFYSVVLNNHQAGVADELWELTRHSYRFVELERPAPGSSKGGSEDFSCRPYLLRAWESSENYAKAMRLAREADVCVFSGVRALPFQKERLRLGLLSFDMSERWLKRGIVNLLSPAIRRMAWHYWRYGWNKKPLYKLCCSGFAAEDHRRLGMFRGKCFRWGYFTRMEKNCVETSRDVSTQGILTPLMWCSRYLVLKHPELPLLMADRLRRRGYRFTLDMYGEGPERARAERLASELKLGVTVRFHNNVPNGELMGLMSRHRVFLFTSDRNEGWGAVANESMANGCALVASDGIGSTPWLVKEGVTGFSFPSPSSRSGFGNPDLHALDALTMRVQMLLDDPVRTVSIGRTASRFMHGNYAPRVAAGRMLTLIDCLREGQPSPFVDGPCSPA